MGYIYLITNDINHKQYIGKTEKNDINERFFEHLQDYKKPRNNKRPLYDAMMKYGPEYFHIQEIEYVPPEVDLEEREQYWIAQYDTFHNGYNATKGGDGKHYLDYDLIIKTYQEKQNMVEVAQLLNINKDSVKNVLKKYNIKIKDSDDISKDLYSKNVLMLDNNNNIINKFNSLKEAAKYLIQNKITTSQDVKGVAANIGKACNHKRKSAYKYNWSF